eukprot:gnl/TRDRNA2_/TRDRNA2_34400_c0_seq2.p1 gnl/TRDRNA2_/TRDRNA2_34400_c0~~gnl/TRDRNA2_/TRDRNA2_34400_c0_seq2.p1  ORF type:complete len:317 (+),score=40.16 gnl/TRDRNA2_/TRDRNA2_34400_c0_seq2:60-1010(+)
MATGTFKAIVCEKISNSAKEGIQATVIRDLPRNAVDGHDVRVEVKAASLNFPELLQMQAKYQVKLPLPFVLCMEGAGVVREVGAKVTSVKPGDRVMYQWMGTAAEEVVVPEAMCCPLPAKLTFSQGAGFLLGYLTGYHGLVHRGHLKAGEWLLVTGAGGGMGTMAVELGKALGARVIAAASSDDKLEQCKKLGVKLISWLLGRSVCSGVLLRRRFRRKLQQGKPEGCSCQDHIQCDVRCHLRPGRRRHFRSMCPLRCGSRLRTPSRCWLRSRANPAAACEHGFDQGLRLGWGPQRASIGAPAGAESRDLDRALQDG